jgi:Zn-dependent peptidase ImmA (M78 family)
MNAHIIPNSLRWAIDRSAISQIDLTARFSRIDEWLDGLSTPTFNQARKIADFLKIPFGYLFVTEIPEKTYPAADLRKTNIKLNNPLSINSYDLINETLRKQNWFKDYVIKEGGTELTFLNKFTKDDNFHDIVIDIRKVLGINTHLREAVGSWSEYLKSLVVQIEEQNIIVLRSGVVGNNNYRTLDVDEFRGFALFDSVAPFIFVNCKDSIAARIFTLAHELAHIWIGESGISNLNVDEFEQSENEEIEVLCDKIAVELLVPEVEFKDLWNGNISAVDNVNLINRKFHVSSIVVLRRAYDCNLISWNVYRDVYTEINEAQKPLQNSAGGNFYNNIFARHSSTLTNAIVHYALEEKMLLRDAASLLHVNISTIKDIATEIRNNHE